MDAGGRGHHRNIGCGRLHPQPTLVAGGGETLRTLCRALELIPSTLSGQLMPGVPRAILRGGGWDGVAVVSKSGAFGQPDFFCRLLEAVPFNCDVIKT